MLSVAPQPRIQDQSLKRAAPEAEERANCVALAFAQHEELQRASGVGEHGWNVRKAGIQSKRFVAPYA